MSSEGEEELGVTQRKQGSGTWRSKKNSEWPGFYRDWALAKVNEHAADIESYIRETLGDSFVVEPMTSEEKKIFFGPLLSRCLQSLCFLQDKKWLYKTYLMYVHKLLVVGKLFLN